jgi:hypothetical protein
MYRSGLVPRKVCWLGMIGGPLLIIFGTAVIFTGNNPSSTLATLKNLSALPEGLWELFLGVYCAIWGFRPKSPILRADAREDRPEARPAASPA